MIQIQIEKKKIRIPIMIYNILSQISTDPLTDFILKVAQISASIVVAITIFFTVQSYRKMRRTQQIKVAHDFFIDYRELQKEIAALYQDGKVKDERMDWAERYLNTIEWFSFLVNTGEITDPRLIGFYEKIILVSTEKILPYYFKQEKIENDNLYPELRDLYDNLKKGKIKVYRHKKSSSA
jgi:hypothetical protein